MTARKSSTATKKRTTRSRARNVSTVMVSDTRPVASMETPRMESTDVITSQLPVDPDPQPDPMPEPTPMPAPMPGPQEMTNCTNCSHIPMGVNAVLTMMVALVFTLSTLVVASTLVIDSQQFQIQAFNDAAF